MLGRITTLQSLSLLLLVTVTVNATYHVAEDTSRETLNSIFQKNLGSKFGYGTFAKVDSAATQNTQFGLRCSENRCASQPSQSGLDHLETGGPGSIHRRLSCIGVAWTTFDHEFYLFAWFESSAKDWKRYRGNIHAGFLWSLPISIWIR